MTAKAFGRYQVIRELGRGGMGTVFLAHDPRFERDVALKLLPAGFLQDPGFHSRFDREAKIIARLEHPAVVPVYDYGEDHGCPYLVMRLMTGGTLNDRLKKGALTIEGAAEVMERICGALEEAHTNGVVHRDLKPANILFDRRGRAYLADFGIARLVASSQTVTVVGTPNYMTPEQAHGRPVDGRTDVYQMGVVLFEMLTGQVPFDADTPAALIHKHAYAPIPSAREINPQLSPAVDAIIAKAMAKEPDQRYQTAMALASAVRSLGPSRLGRQPVVTIPAAPTGVERLQPQTTDERRSQSRLIWMVAGLLVVVAVVLALFLGDLIPDWGAGGSGEATPVIHDEPAGPTPAPPTPTKPLETDLPESTSTVEPDTPTPVPPTVTPSPTPEQVLPTQTGLVAYTVGSFGSWQIMLADRANRQAWFLPGQPANSGIPAWLPDGGHLAFRSDRTGSWQIYTIGLDGGGLTQITSAAGDNMEAVWSPDGSQVAFVSDRDGNKEIYVMNSDGSGQRRLTVNDGVDDDPKWSPDGQWILFESRRSDRTDIYKMRSDGSGVACLTMKGESNSTPDWSPDGSQIAFERYDGSEYHIWVMSVDGSASRQLSREGGENLRPTWSPDGRYIACTSNRGGEYAIWVLAVDGDEPPQRLSPTEGFDAAWSRP